MAAVEKPASRPYHHGDLRRALIEAAVQVIEHEGLAALSLRYLARRVGVSHAAPVHHFEDKAGLLTAVAAEGFSKLADELQRTYAKTSSFLELAVAYVCFAVGHRAYFEVMFRPELYHPEDPQLIQARGQTRKLLYGPLTEFRGAPLPDAPRAGIAAWSLAHGLANLLLSGNLPGEASTDPAELTRSIGKYLFQSSRPSDG